MRFISNPLKPNAGVSEVFLEIKLRRASFRTTGVHLLYLSTLIFNYAKCEGRTRIKEKAVARRLLSVLIKRKRTARKLDANDEGEI